MLKYTVRTVVPDDYYTTELLTRDAFWGEFHPTCDEHYLAHIIREVPAYIPELDLIAEHDGKAVGNVIFSKAYVVDADGISHDVISFGPLSVLPEYKSKGVGRTLMCRALTKAKAMGYKAVIFYGHPEYYPRLGFQSADVFGITNPDGSSFDALMAMELCEGALSEIKGRFYEDSAFEIDEEKFKEFEKNFPPKEPAKMVPIDILLDKLPQKIRGEFEKQDKKYLARVKEISGREMSGWYGINDEVFGFINKVLRENGQPEKLIPGCAILERAKTGFKVIEAISRELDG